MTSQRWQQINALFDAALAREPARRAEFLNQACAGDSGLREEVLSLLGSFEEAEEKFEGGRLVRSMLEAAEPAAVAPGQRIGDYRIEREIGRVGMVIVYLASRADEQFEKRVAIKLVQAGLGGGFLARRFRTERQILANLEHPNIARLIDGGVTEQGQPFLVMEHVEGVPVDEYCDRHRLGIPARLRLFRRICAAVHSAHPHLVVHRDLKPANILVTAEGEPKLLDFGIAKLLETEGESPQQTLPSLLMMTPLYAGPEQVRGEIATTASDVYSLGVLLYGLLTGRPPYRLQTNRAIDIANAVLEQEPERPSAALLRGDPAVAAARSEPLAKLHRRHLGVLSENRGELRQAARYYQESIDTFARTPGAPAMEMGLTLWNLAAVRTLQGNPHGAIEAFQKSLAIFRGRLGDHHPLLAYPISGLAILEAREGAVKKAEEELISALRIQKDALPASHPDIARTLISLSVVLREAGRPQEAEPYAREALEIRRRSFRAGHRHIADSVIVLGRCLAAQKRYEEARPLLEEGYISFRNLFGDTHPRTKQALHQLQLVLRPEDPLPAQRAPGRGSEGKPSRARQKAEGPDQAVRGPARRNEEAHPPSAAPRSEIRVTARRDQ